MSPAFDRNLGIFLTTIGIIAFMYYTFWLIFLPFIDKDMFIQNFFPHYEYAFIAPMYITLLLLIIGSTFIALVFIKSKGQTNPVVPPTTGEFLWYLDNIVKESKDEFKKELKKIRKNKMLQNQDSSKIPIKNNDF
ncbi:dolichol phosphate-mannose biosynthesis regulatory protein [Anaeramoeba ignava]|uniref:Dolichol phosphate-mannose biosynthesis regulatory protein n=1 Tax=Anaeramoeba ignava TaxID=1746090 RepID=A0A9Q0RCG9_ANAIG|nr:dolichol phosphate-mannose biosynthesis regulatory protein [Anaeramoeba ignava]